MTRRGELLTDFAIAAVSVVLVAVLCWAAVQATRFVVAGAERLVETTVGVLVGESRVPWDGVVLR